MIYFNFVPEYLCNMLNSVGRSIGYNCYLDTFVQKRVKQTFVPHIKGRSPYSDRIVIIEEERIIPLIYELVVVYIANTFRSFLR